jgi:hypothetical protein
MNTLSDLNRVLMLGITVNEYWINNLRDMSKK